jgi:hypothetical protein
MQRQRPIRGEQRTAFSARFMKRLREAVQAEARRWDVSESFVVCVAVAYALGVRGQEQFTDTRKAKRTCPSQNPF